MRLIFTLLPLLCLVACTITKRHFGPGYHVEWKKSPTKTQNEPDDFNIADVKQEHSITSVDNEIGIEEVIPTDSVKISEPISSNDSEISVKDQSTISEIQSTQIQPEKTPVNDDNPAEEVKRKTQPLTWVALTLLLGIGLSVILIYIYSSLLYLGSSLFLAGLALLMFVFALISFIKVMKNRDRYKNKWLTYVLFYLSIVALFVAAIYVSVVQALTSMTPMWGY